MKILAIETSCDDTCIAITDDLKILSNVVSSQVKLHARYGGVYPFLAKREHQRNLPIVLRKALRLASLAQGKPQKIDLIAVTVGPGLEPCLWTGINFAKDLAKEWGLLIIPVNHIEAHIAANFIGGNSKFGIRNSKFRFPAICLVVSGGHTQLVLMKGFGKYKILGETRDDAAGECFDKVAKILGLGYPGGPAIAQLAAQYKKVVTFRAIARKVVTFPFQLPRPMIYQKNYDFSFSGLKTAVLYNFKTQPEKIRKSKEYIQAMCAETQQAVIDVLIYKTLKAAEDYKVKTIILGGGVAANEELRKQFNWKLEIGNWKFKFLVPPKALCTDNAAMVGVCAYLHPTQAPVVAKANLRL